MRKSALLKLLALTFVVASVIGVFSACGAVGGKPEHVHEFEYTINNATCTQEGSVLGLCKCGESIVKTLPKTAHNYVNGICSVCGSKNSQEHQHSYQQIVTNPTCESAGVVFYECECGNSYSEQIPALGHNYVNYVCNVCGHALEVTPNEYFYFTLLSDDTYEISAIYRNNIPAEVVLPYEYNGKAVTSIGYAAFYDCSSLTSVVIPDSVTSIGDLAFYDCSSLTSIMVSEKNVNYCSLDGNLYSKDKTTLIKYAVGKTDKTFEIPHSVTSIGNYAFRGCSSLTSIEIGDSVTEIGYGAFEGCSSLTSITISENNANYSSLNGNLYNKDKTTLIQYAIGKTNSKFIIPDSVTSIGEWAFEGCSSLTSVEIPDSVTSIDSWAFDHCRSLTSITVSENNANYCSLNGNLYNKDKTTLIQYAIGKTDKHFIIPNSVTVIGRSAFYDCSSLTSVVIPDSVTEIGHWAFYGCSSLTSIVIGNGVTSIGNYAFYVCSLLTSVKIPDSVTSIGYFAFACCDSLNSVEIPDSVTSISNYAFHGCSSLTSVVIPNSVTSIGNYAFEGCSSLTSIEIPDSVTSIGYDAFAYCSSLTSVVIPDSVTFIGYRAFDWCGSLTIYCEAQSKPSGWDSDWNPDNRPVVWGYKEG